MQTSNPPFSYRPVQDRLYEGSSKKSDQKNIFVRFWEWLKNVFFTIFSCCSSQEASSETVEALLDIDQLEEDLKNAEVSWRNDSELVIKLNKKKHKLTFEENDDKEYFVKGFHALPKNVADAVKKQLLALEDVIFITDKPLLDRNRLLGSMFEWESPTCLKFDMDREKYLLRFEPLETGVFEISSNKPLPKEQSKLIKHQLLNDKERKFKIDPSLMSWNFYDVSFEGKAEEENNGYFSITVNNPFSKGKNKTIKAQMHDTDSAQGYILKGFLKNLSKSYEQLAVMLQLQTLSSKSTSYSFYIETSHPSNFRAKGFHLEKEGERLYLISMGEKLHNRRS